MGSIAMEPRRPSAPADHFSSRRNEMASLIESLTSLRRALPMAHRLAGGAHHGAISALAALAAYLPRPPGRNRRLAPVTKRTYPPVKVLFQQRLDSRHACMQAVSDDR